MFGICAACQPYNPNSQQLCSVNKDVKNSFCMSAAEAHNATWQSLRAAICRHRSVMMDALQVIVEFSGGAELLFDNCKRLQLRLPTADTQQWTIRQLIKLLTKEHLKQRPQLFVDGETVRPGILVLVNNVDWELVGELNYELQPNDEVVFISTLHGG